MSCWKLTSQNRERKVYTTEEFTYLYLELIIEIMCLATSDAASGFAHLNARSLISVISSSFPIIWNQLNETMPRRKKLRLFSTLWSFGYLEYLPWQLEELSNRAPLLLLTLIQQCPPLKKHSLLDPLHRYVVMVSNKNKPKQHSPVSKTRKNNTLQKQIRSHDKISLKCYLTYQNRRFS